MGTSFWNTWWYLFNIIWSSCVSTRSHHKRSLQCLLCSFFPCNPCTHFFDGPGRGWFRLMNSTSTCGSHFRTDDQPGLQFCWQLWYLWFGKCWPHALSAGYYVKCIQSSRKNTIVRFVYLNLPCKSHTGVFDNKTTATTTGLLTGKAVTSPLILPRDKEWCPVCLCQVENLIV